MNAQSTSAIALKLFGIYVLTSAIVAAPTLLGAFLFTRSQTYGGEATIIWPGVIVFATLVVASVAFKILWNLGNAVLKDAAALGDVGRLDGRSLERTLFVLLGVYFCVSAIVDVPTVAADVWARGSTPTGTTIADYALVLSVMAQFLIGLSLIAKWDRWLSFLRNVGVKSHF